MLTPLGNLLSKTPGLSQTVNTANNQINGYTYDANGNTSAVANSGITYNLYYDAENRMSSVSQSGINLNFVSYNYDAQNRRIWSWTGTQDSLGNMTNYTVNVYTPSGQKLGAYLITPLAYQNNHTGRITPFLQVALSSTDQYFGGRRLATMDQLGSAGTYYPWGEVKGSTNPQNTWSYATYWRDSFTGLDYANNRYYSNIGGRFMTPDPYSGSAKPDSPQRWNRFAYVQGDPVYYNDPSGRLPICSGGDEIVYDGTADGFGGASCSSDPTGFCDASQESCGPTFLAQGIRSGGGGNPFQSGSGQGNSHTRRDQ